MRVAILAIPGVQMLDVAGPMDVLSEANNFIGDRESLSASRSSGWRRDR